LTHGSRVLALGEILWDVFDDSTRLGGAPLNFSAHVSRLGHEALVLSALGEDDLGKSARARLELLGLDTRLIQTTSRFPTGTASVRLGPNGETGFQIQRPAAYDAVELGPEQADWLARWAPQWLYHGTLFLTTPTGLNLLHELIRALPGATRFYDVNLRSNSYSAGLVLELLRLAGVVKLNEAELQEAAAIADLPGSSIEEFCREGASRYGWQAACVTLGANGCGLWLAGQYVEAEGYPVEVADPVGAGDGFAAALLHGISMRWPVAEIARFANRVGSIIASRPGAIPDWDLSEVMEATCRP
jgi:fructokinase